MVRIYKCKNCGAESKTGNRGAIPEFCQDCRPIMKKLRYQTDVRTRPNKNRRVFPRVEVLKRDNYECRNCGSNDNLHIHHKDDNGYSHSNRPNNDMDNLITLCGHCHATIHNVKIKKNINLIQYSEEHPGMSMAAIVRVFKISRERVRQIIKRYNDRTAR